MDIKLITYSRTKNYGGILQAYGLYRYLQMQGYDVSFIDYIPRRCNVENKRVFVEEATAKSKIWRMNIFTKWLFSIFRYPRMKKNYSPFRLFMNSKCCFTKKYYSEEELENDVPSADIYITGSDQVWNSQFLHDGKLDKPFYLPFVKTGKRISYASSFGRETIPDEQREVVGKYLSAYYAVSVREQSGKKILDELDIQSQIVVDPTILCPVEEWKYIANDRLDRNYILLYQVSFNKKIYLTAKAVAKKMGKKLICISLDSKDRWNIRTELKVAPSVENWLSYIRYADGIITDSFHACVFSILFKRPFVVNSGNRKEMASRILNLLESLELDKRDLDSFEHNDLFLALTASINWEKCYLRMMNIRKKSEEWLKKAIEN